MRYLICFSYDGSKFNGYQKQPKMRTVQGEIEKALKRINANKSTPITASGRTDAGVHAYNQCAHFELNIEITCEKLKQALNSLIPDDIYVSSVNEVQSKFHARFDVKAKEYVYKINMGIYDPIEKDYVFQYNRKLDIPEMERALKYLEGTHNFKSFVKIDEEKENYTRTILKTSLIRDIKNVNIITISILGTGFMRYMVRNIVGMLIEIGENKYKSEDIILILNKHDRKEAGLCAPACGLYLKNVFY